jgi:hypothetical protein
MMTPCLPAGRRRCTRVRPALLAIGLVAALVSGCGKKGPPLAPLLHVPAAVDKFAARRLGSTVYVQFTLPTKNQDSSTPADVSRLEVYGYTGTPASNDDIVKYGTLVATVPVRRPPPPEEEDRGRDKQRQDQQKPEPKPAARPEPKPKSKPAEPEPGFDQGATVTVTETLTPALMEPVTVARRTREKKKTKEEAEGPILLPSATLVPLPSRVYVAVGVNRKGHRGVFSPHAPVPLLDAPEPPGNLKLSHTETAINLQWTPPPGAPGHRPPGGEQAAAPIAPEPPLPATPLPPHGGPTWYYYVYEVPAVTAAAASPAGPPVMPQVTAPVAIQPYPMNVPNFTDARIEFGTERCYVVRTLEVFAPTLQEESEPSQVACITPRDIYPPAAPKGLTAVVNAGAISLIWDPNTEKDLDGYLVLRAEAPNGTLQPVTPEPIHQTTFNDTTAKPGVRYVYAVVAVDKAGNASAQSDRIEETAR